MIGGKRPQGHGDRNLTQHNPSGNLEGRWGAWWLRWKQLYSYYYTGVSAAASVLHYFLSTQWTKPPSVTWRRICVTVPSYLPIRWLHFITLAACDFNFSWFILPYFFYHKCVAVILCSSRRHFPRSCGLQFILLPIIQMQETWQSSIKHKIMFVYPAMLGKQVFSFSDVTSKKSLVYQKIALPIHSLYLFKYLFKVFYCFTGQLNVFTTRCFLFLATLCPESSKPNVYQLLLK